MQDLTTEADCRLAYLDILAGCTAESGGKFVVKHSTESDYCLTERVRRHFLKEGTRMGLVSESDQLELLAKRGIWTAEDEKAYLEAKDELDSLVISSKNLVIPQQIKDMQRMIKEARDKLHTNFGTRAELIGTTKEVFALRRASEHHILRSFYKDSSLKHPLFTEAEADDIEPQRLHIFMDIYESVVGTFTEKNLKRISVCPFFLNVFYGAKDSAFAFYGKPVIELSLYQLSLFGKGKFYKSLLEEPEIIRCPEEYYSDLSKVIQHYDRQYSILAGKRSAGR